MRLSALLVGGLAVLSAARPVVENPQDSGLVVPRSEELLPIELPSFDSANALEKRKFKLGGGGSGPKKTPKDDDPPKQTPKDDPPKETKKDDPPAKTTKKDDPPATTKKDDAPTTTKKSDPTTTAEKTTTSDDAKTTTSKTRSSSSDTATTMLTSTGTRTTTGTETGTQTSTSATSTHTDYLCAKGNCKGKDACELKKKNKDGTTLGKTPKKSKDTGSTSTTTSATVKRAVQNLAARAYKLITRATDEISMNTAELLALNTRQVDENAFSPNDMSWDSWTSEPFNRRVEGLHGCTVLFISSPKGLFTWHIWEYPNFRTSKTGVDAKMDKMAFDTYVIDQVAKGHKNGQFGMFNYAKQFGLKDSQVPKDAWTSTNDIHITIVSPNHLKTGTIWNEGAGMVPRAAMTAGLRYGAKVNEVISKIKSTIGNVPDDNISVYGYHATTGMPAGVAGGMATAVWNGKNYAIFGEDHKMVEIEVGAVSGGAADCDSSADCTGSKCCTVMK